MIVDEIFPDVYIIKNKIHKDDRGTFQETYNRDIFKSNGFEDDFIQDNLSFSKKRGTIRGLHFQKGEFAQSKLIYVLKGKILDVFVDIRKTSNNFGKYFSIEHVRRHILGQKDKDFREMDKQMNQEIDQGLVMSPQDVNTFDTMDRQNTAFSPEIQAQQADDAVEREIDKEKRRPKEPPSASKPNNNNK